MIQNDFSGMVDLKTTGYTPSDRDVYIAEKPPKKFGGFFVLSVQRNRVKN